GFAVPMSFGDTFQLSPLLLVGGAVAASSSTTSGQNSYFLSAEVGVHASLKLSDNFGLFAQGAFGATQPNEQTASAGISIFLY
ncbi:MAG: hypothetical protein ACHREM_17185, partial [Polyangiales bacterium]